MPRVKLYHTEEEKRIANLEAVKRWYTKNKAKKWDDDHLSSYSPYYHKMYYVKKKEQKKRADAEQLEYEKEMDLLLEEVNRTISDNGNV